MFKPRPRRPGVWPWASHSDRGRGAARLEARDGGGAGAPCKAPWFCPFCGVVPGKHLRPENPTSQPPPQLWAVPQGVRELTRDLVLRCPHPPGALGWCSRAPSWASRALRPLWSRAASTRPCPPTRPVRGPSAPASPSQKRRAPEGKPCKTSKRLSGADLGTVPTNRSCRPGRALILLPEAPGAAGWALASLAPPETRAWAGRARVPPADAPRGCGPGLEGRGVPEPMGSPGSAPAQSPRSCPLSPSWGPSGVPRG